MNCNNRTIRGLLLLLALVGAACAKRPVTEVEVAAPRQERWSDGAVEAFGALPVQDRGRVKPMSTYCAMRMLNINGKRSHRIPEGTGLPTDGETLDPVRWALDVMLFPEQAQHYEVFQVNDSAVLEQVGLEFPNRKRRDRYSYAQLAPARDAIDARAADARSKDAKERSRIETQMLALQQALFEYDVLGGLGAATTVDLGPAPSERLASLFPDAAGGRVTLGEVLRVWPQVLAWVQDTERGSPEANALMDELAALDEGVRNALKYAPFLPAVVPPVDAAVEEWSNPGELAGRMRSVTDAGTHADAFGDAELEALDAFGRIHLAAGDTAAASEAIAAALGTLQAQAEARGEYADVPLERSYYALDAFTRALVLFLLGFLAAAVSWMSPRLGAARKLAWALGIGGLALVTVGVTMRCLLLDRPPVATLYETILFITGVAVLVCLVLERLTRMQVGLGVGLAIGAAGMFISGRYELHEAATQGDTMGGLVAVLNTNFWLATHVVTVTMGYAAGLLAAVLGHVWIVRRVMAGIRSKGAPLSPQLRDQLGALGRMVYGVVAFGLLFSVVGTILGGVWANDSWGRFWGWDPKENGALMIVLYELVIVHARLGGYIKHFGVSVMAVLGGAVVAFSWWHVNLLGVGLHSYGFTDGVVGVLNVYYSLVGAFLVFSLVGWLAFVRPGRKLTAA